MNKMSCGLLMGLLLVAIACFKEVQAKAVVEVHFISFSANCDEDLHYSFCDPYFTFCLDRPRNTTAVTPCYYGSTGKSGYYLDTNHIEFSVMTDIKGIKNPWVVNVPILKDRSMTLVSEVRDYDTFKNDRMVEWNTNLALTVYPSQRDSYWTWIDLIKDDYALTLQYRVYCAANYYGADCSINSP